jgi:hypothetical protein
MGILAGRENGQPASGRKFLGIRVLWEVGCVIEVREAYIAFAFRALIHCERSTSVSKCYYVCRTVSVTPGNGSVWPGRSSVMVTYVTLLVASTSNSFRPPTSSKFPQLTVRLSA